MGRRVLLFGASGQIGRFLVPALLDAGWEIEALSRDPPQQTSHPALTWRRGDLFAPRSCTLEAQACISLGPLDGLVHWLESRAAMPSRLIAFGSTSVIAKSGSPDAAERALAARLRECETRLWRACHARSIACTLLRPTLIYGAGLDRSLTRMVRLATRLRVLPLPDDAVGLRQPVHAADLAAAAQAALTRDASVGRSYDLPGGETLPFDEMLARTLRCLNPAPRLLRLPRPMVALTLRLTQRVGLARGLAPEALERLAKPQIFDADAAMRDLGYAPRGFAPEAAMFRAQPLATMLRRSTS